LVEKIEKYNMNPDLCREIKKPNKEIINPNSTAQKIKKTHTSIIQIIYFITYSIRKVMGNPEHVSVVSKGASAIRDWMLKHR